MLNRFSLAGMAAYSAAGAVVVGAGSGAPTPLYRLYAKTMGLTPLLVTLVFAIYVLFLLAALLTVGRLSDYIGRRPVICGALVLNGVALALFAGAAEVSQLLLARAVQGVAVGAATTTLAAAIMDTAPARASLLNGVSAFVGLGLGALSAAALVTFAPDPLHLVYEVLFVLTAVLLALLAFMPETTKSRPGALAAMRPNVRVPQSSRATFLRITPANIAGWALGAFYLSLMPSVVATTLNVSSPLVGGVVVATLMLTGAACVALFNGWTAQRLIFWGTSVLALGVAVSLVGIFMARVELLILGTLIAGFGFGTNFSGTLRVLLPTCGPTERAGLLSAFFIESYIAFSVPAVAAGLSVPRIGLAVTAYIYGSLVIGLALVSFAAAVRAGRAQV